MFREAFCTPLEKHCDRQGEPILIFRLQTWSSCTRIGIQCRARVPLMVRKSVSVGSQTEQLCSATNGALSPAAFSNISVVVLSPSKRML